MTTENMREFIYCLFAHIDTYGNVEDCDTKQRMGIVMDILDSNLLPKTYDTGIELSTYSERHYRMPDFMAMTSSTDLAIYEKKLALIENLERDRIETVDIPLRLVCTAINALPSAAERVDFLEDLEETTRGALQANYARSNPLLSEALTRYYKLQEEEDV